MLSRLGAREKVKSAIISDSFDSTRHKNIRIEYKFDRIISIATNGRSFQYFVSEFGACIEKNATCCNVTWKKGVMRSSGAMGKNI